MVKVIRDYDPFNEPENGYLGLVEGTMVAVMTGSRAAPEARNMFQCDYVFAWTTDQSEIQGWLPVRVNTYASPGVSFSLDPITVFIL